MQVDLTRRANELFAAAARHHRSGQLQEAERLYRSVLDMDPNHADGLHLYGVLAMQTGRHEEAIELIGRAIAVNGQAPAFHSNLGNAFRASGRLQQAADSFRRALAVNPAYTDALYNLGVVLQESGAGEQAEAAYRRVLTARPDHAAAHSNLGNLLSARGLYQDALDCYQRALRAAPRFLPALINQGNVLKAQGRLDEAVQCYRQALQLDPRHAEAHNNLGLALLEDGKIDEAIVAFQNAASAQPRYAEAHRNLGYALSERGRQAESNASYQRAISLDPADAEARLGLAMTAIPVMTDNPAESSAVVPRFMQALRDLTDWNQRFPRRLGKAIGRIQPFYLAYRPVELVAALSQYGELACESAQHYWTPESAAGRIVDVARERVRVVVICGHIRSQHPVWEMLLRGIVAHMPRERVELFLYHTSARTDDETTWASSHVDRFVQGPKTTAAWIEEARRDRPDVIFYPEIGMDPAVCALAALRLAPVQMASWGHPLTTGLPSMDYFVSGELLEPQGAREHYREELILLPGTGSCTRPPADTARVFSPEHRPDELIRFALPHQPMKFDPSHDQLFPQIARRVGRCEFWLASPPKLGWATERLRARLAFAFRSEGLDPDAYLRVTPWLRRDEFFGFLDGMDVYLDCPAFSGYTTAWQAVHRGLPIVTLEGTYARQRLAAGLLRQMDAPEGIAKSGEQYVEWAARFAEEVRDPLRGSLRRSVLRRAAAAADDHIGAVEALERRLQEAVAGL